MSVRFGSWPIPWQFKDNIFISLIGWQRLVSYHLQFRLSIGRGTYSGHEKEAKKANNVHGSTKSVQIHQPGQVMATSCRQRNVVIKNTWTCTFLFTIKGCEMQSTVY